MGIFEFQHASRLDGQILNRGSIANQTQVTAAMDPQTVQADFILICQVDISNYDWLCLGALFDVDLPASTIFAVHIVDSNPAV
ncbi:Uncharacterised protein [uncultured Blautia sp.]|nr:Uncharacterised protein [uncultured Blautia sp.]